MTLALIATWMAAPYLVVFGGNVVINLVTRWMEG